MATKRTDDGTVSEPVTPTHDSGQPNPLRRRLLAAVAAACTAPSRAAACPVVLDHRLRPLMEPEPIDLCERFAGDVLLVVNTASRCGFTPQFEGLQALYERYRGRGFAVLGFPSDDFRQELESEADVAAVCRLNYGVSFPMFEKIAVSRNPHPLYRALGAASGKLPAWNFNKYLLDRDGRVVAHFGSLVEPMADEVTTAIEALI